MPHKNQSVNDFESLRGVAAPARRALADAGYTRVAQLTKTTEAELMQLHGMGPKAMRAIKTAMREKGLAFRAANKTVSKG